MTQTGRLRLEHRHGWLDAGWQGAGMARRDQSIFYTLFNEITTRLLGSAPSLKVEILASSCKEV